MDRSFETSPVQDAQVRSGPVWSGPVSGPRSVRVQGSAEHSQFVKTIHSNAFPKMIAGKISMDDDDDHDDDNDDDDDKDDNDDDDDDHNIDDDIGKETPNSNFQ